VIKESGNVSRMDGSEGGWKWTYLRDNFGGRVNRIYSVGVESKGKKGIEDNF
jgi:hypothetical protein